MKIPLEIRAFYWYGSLLTYIHKHFRPWSTGRCVWLVIAGALRPDVLGSVFQRSVKPLVAYGRVVRSPAVA